MRHHDEAVSRYIERVSIYPHVLGIIVTGSLARGTEHADSDVDLYLVVTEEAWAEAVATNRIMVVETEGAAYDHGYFDIKLTTLSYLEDAAERGDDPVRDSFAASRVVWSAVPDLEARVARVGRRTDEQWEALETSFLAQARLHGGYFLVQGDERGDLLLAHHAAVHLATAASRALLARGRVLYQGPKYLARAIDGLAVKPAGWVDAVRELVTTASKESGARVLELLEAHLEPTASFADSLSTFVTDNELAWRTRVSPPEYR